MLSTAHSLQLAVRSYVVDSNIVFLTFVFPLLEVGPAVFLSVVVIL